MTGRIAYQGEPGANSHRCAAALPRLGGRAVRVVRGRLRRRRGRRRRPGDDPDRQLDRRPGRGHPPLPAGLRAAHHRRALPADPLPPDGDPGREARPRSRTVHSHVHALGQCRKIIREHGLKPVISGDTAGAAREVVEADDPTQAAISPPLAAEIYGLEILAEDVEDEDHNTTRFVVLSRELVEAPPGNGPVVTSLHLQRPQPAGRALQGARRLRDQRRQHDQAGELHGRRRVHRHPVPGRGRRAPRGRRAAHARSRSWRSSPPT